MSVLYVLVPIALLLAVIGVGWFVWAVRSGQFDDLETPAVRVLFDDEDLGEEGKASSRGDAETRRVHG